MEAQHRKKPQREREYRDESEDDYIIEAEAAPEVPQLDARDLGHADYVARVQSLLGDQAPHLEQRLQPPRRKGPRPSPPLSSASGPSGRRSPSGARRRWRRAASTPAPRRRTR